MNLGFGQLIFLVLVGFFLFGDLPRRVKEFSRVLRETKKEWEEDEIKKKSSE